MYSRAQSFAVLGKNKPPLRPRRKSPATARLVGSETDILLQAAKSLSPSLSTLPRQEQAKESVLPVKTSSTINLAREKFEKTREAFIKHQHEYLTCYAYLRELEAQSDVPQPSIMGEVTVLCVTNWPVHDLELLAEISLGQQTTAIKGVLGPKIITQLTDQLVQIREEVLAMGTELLRRRIDVLKFIRSIQRHETRESTYEGHLTIDWATKNTELDGETVKLRELVLATVRNLETKLTQSLDAARIPWMDRDNLIRRIEYLQKEVSNAIEIIKPATYSKATNTECNTKVQALKVLEDYQKERALTARLKETLASAQAATAVVRGRCAELERKLNAHSARAKWSPVPAPKPLHNNCPHPKTTEAKKLETENMETLKTERGALQIKVRELQEEVTRMAQEADQREVEVTSLLGSLTTKMECQEQEMSKRLQELQEQYTKLQECSRELVEAQNKKCLEYLPRKVQFSSDESDILYDLQATKDELGRMRGELDRIRLEKEDLMKVFAVGGEQYLEKNLADELLSKEQTITRLRQEIEELMKNKKKMERNLAENEKEITALRLEITVLQNYNDYISCNHETPHEELEKHIFDLCLQVEQLRRERKAHADEARSRALLLERHERCAELFAAVTRARRALAAQLAGPDTGPTTPTVSNASCNEASSSFSKACINSSETWSALQLERERVTRLEGIVQAQTQQLERESIIRLKQDRRRAQLQRELIRKWAGYSYDETTQNTLEEPTGPGKKTATDILSDLSPPRDETRQSPEQAEDLAPTSRRSSPEIQAPTTQASRQNRLLGSARGCQGDKSGTPARPRPNVSISKALPHITLSGNKGCLPQLSRNSSIQSLSYALKDPDGSELSLAGDLLKDDEKKPTSVSRVLRLVAKKRQNLAKVQKLLIQQQKTFITLHAHIMELQAQAGSEASKDTEIRVITMRGWPSHDLLMLLREDGADYEATDVEGLLGPAVLEDLKSKLFAISKEFSNFSNDLMARRMRVLEFLRKRIPDYKTKHDFDTDTDVMQKVAADCIKRLETKIDQALDIAKIAWKDREFLAKKIEKMTKEMIFVQKRPVLLQRKSDSTIKVVCVTDENKGTLPTTSSSTMDLKELKEKLDKETAARQSMKHMLATVESLLRSARGRIAVLERELNNTQKKLQQSERKQKEYEIMHRCRETSYDVRSKKLLKDSKNGVETIEMLSLQRKALELRVKELQEEHNAVIHGYEERQKLHQSELNRIQEKVDEQRRYRQQEEARRKELENQIKRMQEENHRLQEHAADLLKMTNEKYLDYLPTKEHEPTYRETELWKELQDTRKNLLEVEDQLRQSREDKDSLLSSLAKIAQEGPQNNLATELLMREKKNFELNLLINQQSQNIQSMKEDIDSKDRQIVMLKLEVQRGNYVTCSADADTPKQELAMQVMDLNERVVSLTRERESLVSVAMSRGLMLERHERCAEIFACVTRARRALTAQLEGKGSDGAIVEADLSSLSPACLQAAATWAELRTDRQRLMELQDVVTSQGVQLKRERRIRNQLEQRRAILERMFLLHGKTNRNVPVNACTYFSAPVLNDTE